MNSFYGVLGTPACRFYDPRLANAITSFGREVLLWCKARIEERGNGHIAHPMKKLAPGEELILGVVAEEVGRYWLKPVDKRERRDTMISDLGDAKPGDLVLAEKTGRPPRITARVQDILGDPFAPRAFSLIAIHKFGIPNVFSDDLLAEAEVAAQQPLGEREDLRHLPIVAIDPADARDHDDAVWAAPAEGGGFDAIVAIADVSFYVRHGSLIDKEAKKRGNSVYFPDRVVPMLPENLSADMCSLKQGQDRAALACHLRIDARGKVATFRFTRAVIRVAANATATFRCMATGVELSYSAEEVSVFLAGIRAGEMRWRPLLAA